MLKDAKTKMKKCLKQEGDHLKETISSLVMIYTEKKAKDMREAPLHLAASILKPYYL